MENVRIWGFKSLLILCICVFCVYEIQEVALNNMDKYSQMAPPRPAMSLLQLHSLANHEEHHQIVDVNDGSPESRTTWITMGLCWSANAQVHGKENFPYKDAAPLSSQLWMKVSFERTV